MTLLRPAIRIIYALSARPPTQGRGRAMAHAVSRRPLIAEARVRSLTVQRNILVDNVTLRKDFPRVTRFPPVRMIPPVLHTLISFIYHRFYALYYPRN
jgi:hypothetical protein